MNKKYHSLWKISKKKHRGASPWLEIFALFNGSFNVMSQKDFRNLLHIIFDSYTSVPLSRVSVTNTKSDVFQLYSLQVHMSTKAVLFYKDCSEN